jgi:hypothetical protein
MEGEKLQLCVVGCGMIGRVHAQAAARHREDIHLHLRDVDARRAVVRTGQPVAVPLTGG